MNNYQRTVGIYCRNDQRELLSALSDGVEKIGLRPIIRSPVHFTANQAEDFSLILLAPSVSVNERVAISQAYNEKAIVDIAPVSVGAEGGVDLASLRDGTVLASLLLDIPEWASLAREFQRLSRIWSPGDNAGGINQSPQPTVVVEKSKEEAVSPTASANAVSLPSPPPPLSPGREKKAKAKKGGK